MPATKKDTSKKGKKEKKTEKKPTKRVLKKKEEKEKKPSLKYFEGVGRRKTAVARVRLFDKPEKKILVNEKDYKEYFPILSHQQKVVAPLKKVNCLGRFLVSVRVQGGGISAQSEAVRHGIARALVEFNPEFRKKLRRAGFLTRDPRMRERKKFGLKRARRAPQWQKR